MEEDKTQDTPIEQTEEPKGDFLNQNDVVPKESQELKPQEKPQEKPKDEEFNLEDKSYENIEKVTVLKGIDFKEIRDEFVNNGCELTDKIIEKYIKAGIPLENVKEIAQSFKALHEQEMNSIAEVVGGRDELNQTLEWAKNNLETEKLQAIRADLAKNPSEITAKAMITYLHNEMLEKEGKAPKYLSSTTGGSMSGDIFKSKAEAIKAMNDSRYIPTHKDYDEAFAKEIDDKLERTNQANGKPLFE